MPRPAPRFCPAPALNPGTHRPQPAASAASALFSSSDQARLLDCSGGACAPSGRSVTYCFGIVRSRCDAQLSISIPNTRFSRRAQLMATCRGVGSLAGSVGDCARMTPDGTGRSQRFDQTHRLATTKRPGSFLPGPCVRTVKPGGLTCPCRPCRPCRHRASGHGRSLPSAHRPPSLRWSAAGQRPKPRSAGRGA